MATTTETGARGVTYSENLENNKILENLRNQRTDGKFCDIVLHVENESFPAHRSILAASSPYFESILKNHRVTKEELTVKWKNSESFKVMLDYMYSGNVKIDESNIQEVLRLADHFLMNKLKNYCENYLEKFVSPDNFFFTKEIAEKYSLTKLQDALTTFFGKNVVQLLQQPQVLEMTFKKFETFLSQPSCAVSASNLLNCIANWVKQDIPGRSQHLSALLQVIEFKGKDSRQIMNHIDHETLYQENKSCLFHLLKSLVDHDIKLGKHQKTYDSLLETYGDEEGQEVVTGVKDDAEEEVEEQEDEITVETVEVAIPSSSRSTRSSRSKGTNGHVVADDSPRALRKRKPTFNSQEWVTVSPVVPKKGRTSLTKSKASREARSSVDDSQDEDGNLDDSGLDSEAAAAKRLEDRIESVIYATPEKWKEGIKCPHCSYLGHSATRLEQHLARVHEEDQTYKCKFCEFECKWNREYYKHMKNHFNGPPYQCESCEYSCDRIQFIISHRMRHTDERPFQCELCDFSSRTKGNLIVHMRIHTGEKPYRCKHCGRCFAMKNTLDQHLATHRDDRPFLCDACGFTTKYQSHLLSHKRIHTGNVFHCQQEGCNYFSPRRSQLAAHTRSHLSIRSHICSTCGRGFIEKSHLIRHERIHLEEKPFKCESCEYSSTRRDKLKEHVLKHHTAEGAVKPSYRPRRGKNNNKSSLSIPIEELNSSQLIITGEVDGEVTHMTEQDVATANLIYEYTNPDGTRETRVVIQNMADFENGQAVMVEGQLKEEDDDDSHGGQVIIHAYEASEDN